MLVKTIIVPNRDKQGWLHGTKNITVDWSCPSCKSEMGIPNITQFCEDGEFFSVHTWHNACGHVVKYTDLKEIIVNKE